MERIFIKNIEPDTIVLSTNESHYLSEKLKLKNGDFVIVADYDNHEYVAVIREYAQDSIVLEKCYRHEVEIEPDIKLSLYQAHTKGHKLDEIVRSCVEMGVYEIIPMTTKRSEHPSEEKCIEENEKYNLLTKTMAEQCGRGIVPVVHKTMTLNTAIEKCRADEILVFYELGGSPIRTYINEKSRGKHIAIFIGPEGGFEKSEVKNIVEHGGERASLGKRILRCETAPIAAISAIMTLSGNLD